MDIQERKKQVLEWALKYIQKGWSVFPIHAVNENGSCTCGDKDCGDVGKHPKIKLGVSGATTDESTVRQWFQLGAPLSNIGIATGANSAISVIDVDIVKKNGAQTWQVINNGFNEPETLTATTGSGGQHLIFIYNSAVKTKNDALGEGVDIRNDGGYIVAPPSIHKSGEEYKWDNWGAKIASLPAHLVPKGNAQTKGSKEGRGRKKVKWSLDQVRSMLEKIPADDRDDWRSFGIILGREFDRSDEAWGIYVEWSNKYGGQKGRNHDEIMHEAFYDLSQIKTQAHLSIATIVAKAIANGWVPKGGKIPLENFLYYAPENNFIYKPTGMFWAQQAIDSVVSMINDNGNLVRASEYLKKHNVITSTTSDPDIEDDVIEGYDNREGMIIPVVGAAMYNRYRKTMLKPGDSKKAKPFVDHVYKVFNKPGDADQFFDYMAHRVQNPGEKPRFSLLIAGEQGVGKDTAISMCYDSIGQWNVANIDPKDLEQSFNEYAAKVLVVISETANTQEMSKWAFNEKTKVLIAGQPDYMQINPKYGQKYTVRLHCGVIMTTNHMMTGIYIPEDDRRYDVIESATKREMGLEDDRTRGEYFLELWNWFNCDDGVNHIYAYLLERNIKDFSASYGQRKTEAHRLIVAAANYGDEWLIDALHKLNDPFVVSAEQLWIAVESTCNGEIKFNEYRGKVMHALRRAGYSKLTNNNASDGRWKLNGENKYTAVYFNSKVLSPEEAFKHIPTLQKGAF